MLIIIVFIIGLLNTNLTFEKDILARHHRFLPHHTAPLALSVALGTATVGAR